MAVTDYIANSDYPFDKVIYLRSSSAPMDGSTFFNFPHGLQFAPLLNIEWSYQADFSVSYSDNMGPTSTNPLSGYLFDLQITVASDATNVYINATGPAATKTVYYRIHGFQPDDFNTVIDSTVSQGDIYVLNTDNNYTKLFIANHVSYSSGAVSITIPHNLGFIPQVSVWLKGTRTQPFSVAGDDGSGLWQIEITTSSLILSIAAINNIASGTIYYRIYADQ